MSESGWHKHDEVPVEPFDLPEGIEVSVFSHDQDLGDVRALVRLGLVRMSVSSRGIAQDRIQRDVEMFKDDLRALVARWDSEQGGHDGEG